MGQSERVRKQVGQPQVKSPLAQVFLLRQMLIELGLEPRHEHTHVRKLVGRPGPGAK